MIAAVGTSGSGKTTTLEYMISKLSREGYTVGAIKHVHHTGFTMDREGTNTWRYAKAGSKAIVALAPKEIVIIKKIDSALNDLDDIIKSLKTENLEVVFIEGFHSIIAKNNHIFKVIVAKDLEDLNRTIEGTFEPILAITGLIAKQKPKSKEMEIPIIDLPSEGEQLLKLIKKHLNEPKRIPSNNSSLKKSESNEA